MPHDFFNLEDIRKAIAEVRGLGKTLYIPPLGAVKTPEEFWSYEPPKRKITMVDADSGKTSECPSQCKIGTALKDRLNVLANVDQLIAENHPYETVLQTLRNAGIEGVNKVNVSRHKQHLLISIEPKEREKVVAKGSPQHRVDSPEFTITIPSGLGINKEQVKGMLVNFNSKEKLFTQISRLESYLDFLDSPEGQKVPNSHGHRAKYLDLYKNYVAVIASMKDATGGSEINWEDFMKRIQAKDKPPSENKGA